MNVFLFCDAFLLESVSFPAITAVKPKIVNMPNAYFGVLKAFYYSVSVN